MASTLRDDKPTSVAGPYAILSHTWDSPDDEVTFQDIQKRTFAHKSGYQKIKSCIEQAQEDGLQQAWVDTCCINKENRIELGKAINYMFDWYRNAKVCYVYLADVTDSTQISSSRWFTRGWTLQELVAPKTVRFYSQNWRFLGDKFSLRHEIMRGTLPNPIDTHVNLDAVSLTQRFRWARYIDKPASPKI